MAGIDAYDIFVKSLVARCQNVYETLQVLSVQEFPSEAPSKAALALAEAAFEILDRAQTLSQQVSDSLLPDPEIEKEVALISTYLDGTTTILLPMLRTSRSLEVPTEIVRPFQRIVSALFPGAQIIVSIMPEQNYRFREVGGSITNWLSNFGLQYLASKYSFPEKLFRLDIPEVPSNNVLSHTSLAHEIGHALYMQNNVETVVLANPPLDNQTITEAVDAALKQMQADLNLNTQAATTQNRSEIEDSVKRRIRQILGNIAKELYSDAVGVLLLGPAFVCGTSTFLLPGRELDAQSGTHPSNRYRIQFQLRVLLTTYPGLGYSKYQTVEIDNMIQPWSDFVGKGIISPQGIIEGIVFRAIHKLKDLIIAEAKKAVPMKLRFTPQKFVDRVPDLCDRILQGLPPNEVINIKSSSNEPIIGDFQSIINAGWQVYICRFEEMEKNFQNSTKPEVLERFYGLIAKGLESCELQRRYIEESEVLRGT